jgi:hypothetical protein
MRHPTPSGLRLVCASSLDRPPPAPFGLPSWSADAPAIAVLLDATDADLTEAPAVARQVPDAATLPPGTHVFVLGAAVRPRAGLLRWFGGGTVAVGRPPRCAALLARGYTAVGAFVDDKSGADLVYAVS